MNEIYIGLMSGTSVNGIDAALIDLSATQPKLLAALDHPIPDDLRQTTLALMQPQINEIHILQELDQQFGYLFAEAALELIKIAGLSKDKVRAIGSHGQTIRHQATHRYPYTLQIGDPNVIAACTDITTIADFRRRDIANGGQGAPFAPIFHAQVLSDNKENRAVVNIGGIANITLLSKDHQQALLGFDTGPGNGLMDSWIHLHLQKSYDKNGQWAAEGMVIPELLDSLLKHPFFQLSPPKSTGRDHFNLEWLRTMDIDKYHPKNVQTTLAELTATSITQAIKQLPLPMHRIIICGGGAHNTYLVDRIHTLSELPVNISDEFGISADWLEAELFAWLAQQTLHRNPLDMTKITGAKKSAILGGIYL